MEDNHFIAHPEGGVTTEAALAEQAKAEEVKKTGTQEGSEGNTETKTDQENGSDAGASTTDEGADSKDQGAEGEDESSDEEESEEHEDSDDDAE